MPRALSSFLLVLLVAPVHAQLPPSATGSSASCDELHPLELEYLLTGTEWSHESGQASAALGRSVSTAGDVNGDGYLDVIVGAPGWGGAAGAAEGAAWVFHGTLSGLETTAAWSYESGQGVAQLGASVSTAGDVNGDGYSDVIVGAPFWDGAAGADEGAVFVFHGSASGLATTAAWSHESGQADARLGLGVSTAGDVNGDGYSDVIIGAIGWSGVGLEGAVFVFHGSASGLATTATWSHEGGQFLAQIGDSLSTAGDVNGDGYSDVIVGVPFWDGVVGEDEGAAIAFYGSASGLSTAAAWRPEGGQIFAHFGNSVSTAGDVNRDGYSDIIVGAMDLDGNSFDEGAAFVFHGSASGLATTADWSHQSGQAAAQLGTSVSTVGDVNDDGYSDVIVGAPQWDGVAGIKEGAVFVFHGSGSGLAPTAAWGHEGGQAGATLGWSVSTAGDVNGDGYSDIIVGAPHWDGATGIDEGSAFVFHGPASCALNAVDLMTAPVTPPRASPWVYDLVCGVGRPGRLNPGLVIGREVSTAPVPVTTTFDTALPGTGNTLTLYQLACGCPDTIQIVKSTTADELVLH